MAFLDLGKFLTHNSHYLFKNRFQSKLRSITSSMNKLNTLGLIFSCHHSFRLLHMQLWSISSNDQLAYIFTKFHLPSHFLQLGLLEYILGPIGPNHYNQSRLNLLVPLYCTFCTIELYKRALRIVCDIYNIQNIQSFQLA